jgi:hypothetical protein
MNILIFGASYGMLLGSKFLKSGHDVHFIALKNEVDLINSEGFSVSIIKRPTNENIIITSKELDGKLTSSTPEEKIDLKKFDLVFLAMQEFQYTDKKITDIIINIGILKIPTVSVMNIPPHTYLKNFSNVPLDRCRQAYQSLKIWDKFDKNYLSTSSPDPQAFRPQDKKMNFLQVRLASNFKVAEFGDNKSNAILYKLENDIKKLRIPVYLNIVKTKFIIMAKWPMLICGNYRCVKNDKIMSIYEAVNENKDLSERIYNDVVKLCLKLGADTKTMVPFEHYFKRTKQLDAPSSIARAIDNKKINIERFDKLLEIISMENDFKIENLDIIIKVIDNRLEEILNPS